MRMRLGYSKRIAPGVRISASRRGVRTKVGVGKKIAPGVSVGVTPHGPSATFGGDGYATE